MKRWFRRIALCLILGVVTTVAVAWGCAQNDLHGCTLQNGRSVTDKDFVWRVDRRDTRWITQIHFLQSRDPRVLAESKSERRAKDSDALWDGWARRSAEPAQLGDSFHRMDRIWGFGWPLRTMSYREYILYDGLPTTSDRAVVGGLLVRPSENQLDYSRPHALPLTPIWHHFLISTILCAAAWYGLIFGFAQVRRAGRLRRGHCPQCAYDLRHDLARGCPECGWNRAGESIEGSREQGIQRASSRARDAANEPQSDGGGNAS